MKREKEENKQRTGEHINIEHELAEEVIESEREGDKIETRHRILEEPDTRKREE